VGGEASVGDIYVDPAQGNDDNPGTFESPIKTIAAGIEMWSEGRELVLMAGTFSAASGETWGYTLPGGVIIRSNSAGVVLEGTPLVDGMTAQGAGADIRNVTLTGFATALSATAGELSLSGVAFAGDAIALDLAGTAAAVVSDYCTFDDVDAVAQASGTSSLTVSSGVISASGAITVADDAALTMIDVTVDGAESIIVSTTSADTFIADCTFDSVGGSRAMDFVGAGTVRIENTIFDQATVGVGVAINFDSAASLSLEGVDIQGYDDGVVVVAAAAAVMTNGSVQHCNCGLAIWGTSADIDDYTVHYNGTGIHFGSGLKLRNSRVEHNTVGIRASVFASPDFGTEAGDGLNTFRNNSETSYEAIDMFTVTTWARGNTWRPNTQGSEPNGGYIVGTTITGPTSGLNFTIGEFHIYF
jgi:hypothetical protein